MEEGVVRGGKVRALIEKATNSTAAEVDPRLLSAVKSVVRRSDLELRVAAQTLMDLMKRDHSQVRYISLLIIDELFMRSKLFRTILVENFDQLLSLSVGFRRNSPLPAPPATASNLRGKAIEFLEKWNASFGVHYRQIRLGVDYLKNTLRFQFPNLQVNAARVQQERRERETRTKEILNSKFEALKQDFSSIKEEIQSTVDEIEECLEIVHTKEENLPIVTLDSEDSEEFYSSELRQIRLDSLKEAKKVREDDENKVVFDALREQFKLLETKHLAAVQESITVLIRVETADIRARDSILKELIDLRNSLQSIKKRCIESGCSFPDTTKKHMKEDEEDFWEVGEIVPSKVGNHSAPSKSGEQFQVLSPSQAIGNDVAESSDKGNQSLPPSQKNKGTNSSSLRDKLLAEAPVVKWGSSLDNWGSNRDILANHRGLELESHWGRVDPDAVIPAEKIQELSLHATVYKEEQVEIQPCRAPLRKGGLCQRRDLKVCPFHGLIITRDDEGNPINQNQTSTNEKTLDLGTDLVDKLAKQAIKNVRDKDNQEAKKRKMDKQLLKRAKLAKVREHNEAVLRDAALASTSNSAFLGEDEGNTGNRQSGRNRKDTLASMLRKKVTTKDRLAEKLLNSRTSNATIQELTLGEDAKYREAFPNQW